MPHSHTPAYNLKVVLKETGIAADTLRAWERRYGLPMPKRTEGGHRLYSQHDIETIKWLMKRQAEGLSISRAVELWNVQLAANSDPLANALPQRLIPPDSLNIEALRSEWLAACFNYDTIAAEQILNQAFAVNSVEVVCDEIIRRGLYEVGESWHQGTASVQQEHFASGIAARRLEALISATPPPTREETIILACPPDEWHAFPLLLTNLLLRRRGWNAIYLGANVPTARMQETVESTAPKLVILSAQTLVSAVHLREMARELNKNRIQSAFGGRVFNNINALHGRIPAHFLGNTIEQALPAIENLIINPRSAPKEERINKVTLQLADDYRQHRQPIENALTGILESQSQSIEFLGTANQFLGDSLIATLELGSMAYLSTDIHWLSTLLINHRVSGGVLPSFLATYARSVHKIMGDSGQDIVTWLNLEAQKYQTAV